MKPPNFFGGFLQNNNYYFTMVEVIFDCSQN